MSDARVWTFYDEKKHIANIGTGRFREPKTACKKTRLDMLELWIEMAPVREWPAEIAPRVAELIEFAAAEMVREIEMLSEIRG